MRLPAWLSRFGGTNSTRLDASDDLSIVKMGTLRAMLARVVRLIPSPGVSLGRHYGSDGDIWYLPEGSGGGDSTHPFKVTKSATDLFLVQSGTCEGITIATEEIDVGSTRPCSILAYPQYTLGIDSGVFVNTMAVRSGSYAPVLETSTSVFSDVDSGITSAGTQARALIAYILEDDVIVQIAKGNIFGTWADAGLTGAAAGHFNKNG
jgi:hypothetical protein